MPVSDREACYRAYRARDARFDGRFFVGVTSTGIYCRPTCPARTAKLGNCVFFPSATAAQRAGFRACRRCHPGRSPALGPWRGTSATAARALALIAEGALDGDAGAEELAERLGVGGRHLRRVLKARVGATPIAIAQARRMHLAKGLIEATSLRMVDVAMAAGFRSVRRFNEAFRQVFGHAPSALRTPGAHGAALSALADSQA